MLVQTTILRDHDPATPERAATDARLVTIADLVSGVLQTVLGPFGLRVEAVTDGAAIPGSYWGDEEAGLIGHSLHVRADTPLHSALHEAGHYVCMDSRRRASLHTDAGGTDLEENAVCYWQILMSDRFDGVGRSRMCADMDRWGYSFRLGSAAAWFTHDAEDARAWLIEAGLLGADDDRLVPTVRQG